MSHTCGMHVPFRLWVIYTVLWGSFQVKALRRLVSRSRVAGSHIVIQELENGSARGETEVPSFGIDTACHDLVKGCLTLRFFKHLVRSHALNALILHSPIEHWILSLTTIINSCWYCILEKKKLVYRNHNYTKINTIDNSISEWHPKPNSSYKVKRF